MFNGHQSALLLAGLVPGECTAIDLLDRIERHAGRRISGSGVYVQLDRLAKGGLVESKLTEKPGPRGRRSRIWWITGEGRRALNEIQLALGGGAVAQ